MDKNKVSALNDSMLSLEKNYNYQTQLTEKLDRYTLSVKKEKPLLYYIQSPIFHALPRFLFGPEVKIYMKRFQLPGKFGSSTENIFTLLYCLIIAFGLGGMCMLFLKGLVRNRLSLIVAVIPFYTIVVHALIIRVTYNRFLIPAWAFIIICASYFIVSVIKREKD